MISLRKACCVFVLLLSLIVSTTWAETRRADHVFVISFDQGAPAGIQKSDMPLFKKMVSEGAYTWEACTIVPSLTLPSHTSMVTGVGIQKHQIDWNDWQPTKSPVKVPTMFNLAKKSGLRTAIYAAKEKFKTFDQPGSLDALVIPSPSNAKDVAAAFAADVGKLKPNLCLIHFGDPDVAGHQFGVNSPEKMKAFADCDAALSVIVKAIKDAGILDSSVIILTADHGGHDIVKDGKTAGTHGSSSVDDVTIPWVAWGKGVKKKEVTAAVVIYDTPATALWLLGVPVPESFWGRPVVSAFQD